MKYLLLLMLAFAVTASAADVTGKWKGSAETPNGTVERTFDFKVDGTKLTGETTSNMFGTSPIIDGKIEGDNLSFIVNVKFQDNEFKVNYKGKVVSKDEIKLSVEVQDNTLEYTIKRVS